MWESFNQLPLWLKAIIIIAPMGVLIGMGIALFIKILKSEKIAIGKGGISLEDIETQNQLNVRVDEAISKNVKTITEVSDAGTQEVKAKI